MLVFVNSHLGILNSYSQKLRKPCIFTFIENGKKQNGCPLWQPFCFLYFKVNFTLHPWSATNHLIVWLRG